VRASDRLIGIVLGILLGLAIVIAFVFLGSRDTIDAPSRDGGDTETQQTAPLTTTEASP
jgi:hypothetical protein